MSTDRSDRLFGRAHAILAGRGAGFGEPILWHLALRHYGPAMLEIAARETREGKRSELGRTAAPFSPLGLMYRAYRQGEPNAAQNIAMSLFNIGDMAGYRRWIRLAARRGDADAGHDAKCFALRQPHAHARRLRRLRPLRRDER